MKKAYLAISGICAVAVIGTGVYKAVTAVQAEAASLPKISTTKTTAQNLTVRIEHGHNKVKQDADFTIIVPSYLPSGYTADLNTSSSNQNGADLVQWSNGNQDAVIGYVNSSTPAQRIMIHESAALNGNMPSVTLTNDVQNTTVDGVNVKVLWPGQAVCQYWFITGDRFFDIVSANNSDQEMHQLIKSIIHGGNDLQ